MHSIMTPTDSRDYKLIDVFTGAADTDLQGLAPTYCVTSSATWVCSASGVNVYELDGSHGLRRNVAMTDASDIAKIGPIGTGLTASGTFYIGSSGDRLQVIVRCSSDAPTLDGDGLAETTFEGITMDIRENGGNLQVRAGRYDAGVLTTYTMDNGADSWNNLVGISTPYTAEFLVQDNGDSLTIAVPGYINTWTLSESVKDLYATNTYLALNINDDPAILTKLKVW